MNLLLREDVVDRKENVEPSSNSGARLPVSLLWGVVKLFYAVLLSSLWKKTCDISPPTVEIVIPVIFYLVVVFIHGFCWLLANHKDISVEIAEICFAQSHRITDTDTVSILLDPGPCLVASLEMISLCIYVFEKSSYLDCETCSLDVCKLDWGLIALEMVSPLVLLCGSKIFKGKKQKDSMAVRLCIVIVVYPFIRLMQLIVLPLSWLKYLSEWNVQQRPTDSGDDKSELLSFEMCNKWVEVPAEASWGKRIFIYLQKLCDRYTVIYSFLKLVVCIVFSMMLDTGYLSCGGSESSVQSVSATGCFSTSCWFAGNSFDGYCDDTSATAYCVGTNVNANCVLSSYIVSCVANSTFCQVNTFRSCYCYHSSYECVGSFKCYYLPPDGSMFVGVSSECLCNNWLTFQFTVMALHTIHFVAQCYYYLRFNHFNPQQHQIECVQQYSFAGENLKLFLTHPSICFLSLLEAAAIIVVWVQVILNPGLQTDDNYGDFMFIVEFAIFTTIIEVYKANLSVAWANLSQRKYAWALWSLFRVDLFVFFACTLFFQSFIFPFALGIYLIQSCTTLNTDLDSSNEEETLLQSLVAGGKSGDTRL
jgi:hypothetical protein